MSNYNEIKQNFALCPFHFIPHKVISRIARISRNQKGGIDNTIFANFSPDRSITSGSIWVKDVAKRTPPPKHNKSDTMVRFHTVLVSKKYLPIFKGKNPKVSVPAASRVIVMKFVDAPSCMVAKGEELKGKK